MTPPLRSIHVVAAVITDARGRILLNRRNGTSDMAGLWEFPGGKREPGETSEQALARELHEELGIEAEVGDWLKRDIIKYGLKLKPNYRPWDKPVGGSDNASFAKLNIPVIWYHTGGHPDYHMPGDHSDKINWSKVVDITKASFLNMWNLANEKKF